MRAATVRDIVNSDMDRCDDTPTQVPTGYSDDDGKNDWKDFNWLPNPADLFRRWGLKFVDYFAKMFLSVLMVGNFLMHFE